MKWRNGGTWLVFASILYLVWAFGTVFGLERELVSFAPLFYITTLILPFVFPPLGRWLNLDVRWDKIMFSWFSKKEESKHQPEGLGVPKDVTPSKEKEEQRPHTYYRLGITDNNRVSFSMGYSEITMNSNGVQNMINQLQLYMQQIKEGESTEETKE